jgi:hypothetical protein
VQLIARTGNAYILKVCISDAIIPYLFTVSLVQRCRLFLLFMRRRLSLPLRLLLIHGSQQSIGTQSDVKHRERYGNPAFQMCERHVNVSVIIISDFCFSATVPADPPFVAEKGDWKLILKLMYHIKFRLVQMLVGLHHRPPNEAHDDSGAGNQYIPSVVPKGGKENNEERHQTGIQGQQVIVGVLALVADVLRRLDKKLVLLQQMVLVFLAVFLWRSALESASGLRTRSQLSDLP